MSNNSSSNYPKDFDDDPCNSYEWSIFFMFIMALCVCVMLTHLNSLFRRTRTFDFVEIMAIMIYFMALITFGPYLVETIDIGQGVKVYSDNKCKLMYFTEFGFRNVISVAVMTLIGYAWVISLKTGEDVEKLNNYLREKFPWFIIAMFALEGVFGLAPALYARAPFNKQFCGYSPLDISPINFLVMNMVLRTVVPYIIPLGLSLYPMIVIFQRYNRVTDIGIKSSIKDILLLASSYFIANTPYTILMIVDKSLRIARLQKVDTKHIDFATFCNFKWVFFIVHLMWFLILPVIFILTENRKGNALKGSGLISDIIYKIRRNGAVDLRRLI